MLSWIADVCSAKMAFFPPNPPSYEVGHHGDGAREPLILPTAPGVKRVPGAEVFKLPRGRSSRSIVVVNVPSPTPVRHTLLHSHGNAVDLGIMLPFYEQLARLLHCNVVGYDYTGYGRSSGSPAPSACLKDVRAVYDEVLQRYKRSPRDVVLYGQSVGTGPTTWLASKVCDVAGVVLHSPFLSGMRILNPRWTLWPAAVDLYPNYKFVGKVESPTLIMHGTKDVVIPIDHATTLYGLCKNPAGEGCQRSYFRTF
jgi:abhydrolase domain-containing protein 17